MTSSIPSIPVEPICLAPNGADPCPFWKSCHVDRQRLQSGQQRSETTGLWLTMREPLRGDACWAYVSFRDVRTPTEPVAIPAEREPGEDPF